MKDKNKNLNKLYRADGWLYNEKTIIMVYELYLILYFLFVLFDLLLFQHFCKRIQLIMQ